MTARPIRAPYRVETPGLHDMYCLREGDALESARSRGSNSSIWILCRDTKTGQETWSFWRTP